MDTTLTIKTKKVLRDEAKKTAEKLGLPLGTVVNALLKQFARDKEIVLSLNVPNAKTQRALRQASSRKGCKTFKTFQEFEKYVRSL
mgnify:FL=1